MYLAVNANEFSSNWIELEHRILSEAIQTHKSNAPYSLSYASFESLKSCI